MKTLHTLTSLLILFFLFGCSSKVPKLLTYEQNTILYVNSIKPLHLKSKNFSSRYFMPWSIEKIKLKKEKALWANLVFKRTNTYYAESTQLWNTKVTKRIIETTNFSKYNSKSYYAITTTNAQIRNLPTNKPFYKNPSLAGEGFPFDYLQNSRIHVNTPVLISHYTSDGSWAFVQNPFSKFDKQPITLFVLDLLV